MKSYKLYFGWLLMTLLFAQSAWGESSFRKTIWPLKFENIDLSETENQEETWNLLLKYKLFARGLSDGTGIVFAGQKIFITDEVGYSGSAIGDFKMGGNSNHRLGGPLLFGGEFINETGEDTISTGPTRFLGKFSPSANGKDRNAFKGKFCFDGGFEETNTAAGMKGEILDETACESDEVVPFVDITLDVPILSEDVSPKYHEAILADGKTRYIHVPPYTESDSASFNYFVESIQFKNNGKLYVVMPPGGRLTKVFLENTLSGIGTTADTDILVVEAKSESAWNEADSTWDVSNANITVVENSNYAGNLLFYTPQDITIGAGQKQMQGTYISGGTISFAQHTNFAGQLLAKAIIINADFSAKDFRYVPFDPPVLNLDPTALATGRFLENDQIQTVPVSLDTLSATDVAFNYCFVLSAEENANKKLLANANDFDTKDMPICAVGADGLISGDSGIVYINKGSLTPTAETAVKLLVKADNLIEGDESFKLYIFNMSGAVLPGNKRSGFFTLFIQDADDNLPPAFDKTAYSFDVDENSPVGTLIGTVLATDPNKGDAVRYYLEKDTNLFVLDPETGNISVDQAVLDYESKDTTYSFNIYATDGKMNSDLVTVTIHVKDVNEEPSLSDTAFSVAETAAVGDVVGTLDGIDPDSLNKAFSTLSYKLIGESLTFEVASSGVISVKGALDYETTPVYSLRVEVSDGEYGDTATVTIHILDVNEEPVASDVVVQISENCQGCAADKTVPASDPDGDNLFYQVLTDTSGLFTIDATGLISLKTDKTLDYEQDSVYALQVSVTDADGLSATATVTVKVVNVNEKPVASDVVVQISENCQGCAADKTVPASDPDGDNLFYQVLTDTSGLFTIDSLTGLVSLKTDNVLDYEQDSVYTLQVSVRDSAGLSDTANVTVRVLDVNEEPVASDVVVQISENCQGCAADKTVPASDPDGDKLVYKVLTDASGLFTIDSTGLISLNTGKALDYEQDSVYTLQVSVTDVGGLSDTAKVTVRVLDVNEKPTVYDVVVNIPEDCDGCMADRNVSASDPDGDKLVFRIVADTSGLFTIDSLTGRISLRNGNVLDYEKNSVYKIQASATDPSGLSDTATVTINVLNKTEKVEIIQVESGDSTWKKPDTVYTNNSRADVTYTTPEGNRDTTVSLKEGKNIVVVRYQDGSDTVVVLLNTQIPEVKISASSDSTGRISGVTIVEQKDADDTASYVRSNDPVISVSVTDRSGKKAESKTSQIKIHLDTVFVSKDKLQEAEKTIGKVTLSDESDLSSAVKVSHQVVGENKIQVSYDDTTAAGIVVKVSYFTDSDGKRLTDENGEEYYEVSTSFKNATGTQILLTYTVDALGTVKSDRDGKTIYKVSYATESAADKTTDGVYQVEVSYLMNSSGDISLDEGGNVPYAVRYVYTDVYGNSAFAETKVIVDTVPPKVKILSPENASVVSNVSIEVRWTVNDIEQDTLTYQGLNEGKNVIIRTYRDKAGNEASDSVVVILSSGKLIEVEIADPLVAPDAKTVEKFTSASNSEPGTSYALSVYNAKTGKEEELQAGSKEGKSEGSHKEPYEGLSGKHLGVTLEIGAQAPAIDETGTLSTLESIVENGYVALDSGGGWDRTMTTVEDYVENYCSADFRRAYDSIGTAASLYKTKITIKIWFFTTIGDFVDDYSFTQEISPDHVDKTGAIQMYFELKPDGDGFLRNSDGRLLGTGAYIFNTDVKIRSQLQCELPDHERGYIRKDDDRILTKWGYRRPNQ